MNNSRVLPARLLGRIGGKAAELLVVKNLGGETLEVLCQPAARFIAGAEFVADGGPRAVVLAGGERGRRLLRFDRAYEQVLEHGYRAAAALYQAQGGEAAARRGFDLERYQTVYARDPGSIAAPTAGLHFTPEVLARVREKHELLEITLGGGRGHLPEDRKRGHFPAPHGQRERSASTPPRPGASAS